MVKALVLENVRILTVKTFDKPEVENEAILAKIELAGVCGTDRHLYEGHLKPPYPIIPGHEIVAKIEEIGEKARQLEVRGQTLAEGDLVTVVPGTNKFCGRCYYCRFTQRPTLCENRRVYGVNMSCKDFPHLFGGWSEYVYLDPVNFWVYKLPKDLPREVAVLIEPMAVASRAFERAFAPGLPYLQEGYGPGKSVVVQGVGPIGLLVVAVANISGAGKIIAIDSVDERLEFAQKLGAETINLNEYKEVEERIKEVKRRTNGVGVDVVFECTGVPAAFAEGIRLTRNGGKYVEVGHYTDSGGVEIRPHIICRKDIDVLGSWAYPPTQFWTAINLLCKYHKDLPLGELVTHQFRIGDYKKIFETIEERKGLKIVVKP